MSLLTSAGCCKHTVYIPAFNHTQYTLSNCFKKKAYHNITILTCNHYKIMNTSLVFGVILQNLVRTFKVVLSRLLLL